MRHFTCFLLIFFSYFAQAQLHEDFSDGELLHQPTWQGNLSHFAVNEQAQLQLQMNAQSGNSWLATAYPIPSPTAWLFDIRLAFSPSPNNYARVYLAANHSSYEAITQALFLQFGESGQGDAIELFWQDETGTHSICRSADTLIASAFAMHIEVKHADGQWQLWGRAAHNSHTQLLATGQATYALPTTTHFGLLCHYTASNGKRFYFDNIKVATYSPDLQAPHLRYVTSEDSHSIRLIFSESMQQAQLNDSSHYHIENVGQAQEANSSYFQQHVVLRFASPLHAEHDYALHLTGLQDVAGNNMADTTLIFKYHVASTLDILFNEMMVDPIPPVGLPEAEYVELYNASEVAICLQGWQMHINNTSYPFEASVIPAHSYLLLCKNDAVASLQAYGNCVGFSSFSLPNAGAQLRLSSPQHSSIHAVRYNKTWYHDPNKDDGGWSLAQINPHNSCGGGLNWQASAHELGGSPAQQNAHWNTTVVEPKMSQLLVNDNSSLSLHFNQQMQIDELQDPSHYSVDKGIGHPFQVMITDTAHSILLLFQQPLQQATTYQLTIEGLLHNCIGQAMSTPPHTSFMLNKIAESGDILIHEVMPDPLPSQGLPPYEYIELYNTANAPISLAQWQLHIDDKKLRLPAQLIAPHSYLLLCGSSSAEALSSYAPTQALAGFVLRNTQGRISLCNADGQLIHHIAYHSNWHEDGKADGGWSLEMIDTDSYCLSADNWGSSVAATGGSPGHANSIEGTVENYPDIAIERVQVIDSMHILVRFNRAVDSSTLNQVSSYSIQPHIGNPNTCHSLFPAYRSVYLSLSSPLVAHTLYTLYIEGPLEDCLGNSAQGQHIAVGLPQPIHKHNLVINELLFDAQHAKGEYIELVNRSDRVIALEQLSLSYININNADSNSYTTPLHGGLLLPQGYVVYSASPQRVMQSYPHVQADKLIYLEDFPPLSSTQGLLQLHLKQSRDSVIDRMHYHQDMHYSLLHSTQGVSLENIDYARLPAQWHSAASTAQYGTPTYRNSQYQAAGQAATTHHFECANKLFSPDNDGHEDILQIAYSLPQAGYQLHAQVFDSDGIMVRQLYNGELLGSSGTLYWDGQTDAYDKAPIGIYILWFEYFNLQGEVGYEKVSVVVATKW